MQGDPALVLLGQTGPKISVWIYANLGGGIHVNLPWITTQDIATAIGLPSSFPLTNVEVDALMVWQGRGPVLDIDEILDLPIRTSGGGSLSATARAAAEGVAAGSDDGFGTTDDSLVDAVTGQLAESSILFSIAPLNDPTSGAQIFDGGEIWVWNTGDKSLGAAEFLDHGGHLWDTAFDVCGSFGGGPDSRENVISLEAVGAVVPEPAALVSLALGLLGVGAARRRRAAV